MDRELIPEGVKRCPLPIFLLWLIALLAIIGWGIYAGLSVWIRGLNITGLNNYFGFGLYIWVDLSIIALGAGAFFTGFLYYGMSPFFPTLKEELYKIINLAVVVGFCCYTGALLVLSLEIGQPIRSWFSFWHPNVHSMLTEVIFCITCYTIILIIEYLPIITSNRKLQEVKAINLFGHNLHKLMAMFALTGTFLSFFHQGSLGGVPGVMFGRPFAYRTGFFIWPWTFFLFTVSAIACGPAFTALICRLLEKITRKQLVDASVYELIAKIVGVSLAIYLFLKLLDTLYWALVIAPKFGFKLTDFYKAPYGIWLLFAEVGICGVIPVALLLSRRGRHNPALLFTAFFLDCAGICINRFAMTVEVLAIPVMPFDRWAVYVPTWAEWAPCAAMLAYGAMIISLSYRYLPIFPRERELRLD